MSSKNFKKLLPVFMIILIVLAMAGRYLTHGVPHEFITVEYKGTFEGDYDFTMELVRSLTRWHLPSLWSTTYSGPIFVFAANLHVVAQALLYFLTHNQALSVKIYQVLYFILSGIGMYLLSYYIYRKRLIGLFCAILYMFTPFFMGEMLSYLHYSVTYFCFPFAFFLVLKAMDCRDYIYYSLLAALFISFNFLSHPQNAFIAGFFYGLFMLGIILFQPFRFFTGKDRHSHKVRFIKALKVFSVISITVFFLCLFFLLPTLIDGYPYTRSLEGAGTWLNPAGRIPGQHSRIHSQSLLSSITMLHWSWFITPLKGKEYPPVPFVLIYSLPFLLAAWGVFATRLRLGKRVNPRLLLFVLLGLASLNFALGTGLHSFGLFNWAYKFIPFFHMARAPYRYFYQGALSICLLSGLALYKLPKKRAAALFSVVSALYLFGANYYANDYNWTFLPSEEPHYFSQIQSWLKENNKNRYRIIETFITPSYLGNDQRMLPNGLDLLLKRLDKDYLAQYLALFGFKYILAPSQHTLRQLTFDSKGYLPPRADDAYDDPDDPEEYYAALTTEFYPVYERLKDDPGFRLYTAGTKDVAIFENKKAFADYRLYPAEGLMILGGINAYDFIDLERFSGYFKEDSRLRLAPVFITQSKNLKSLQVIKAASEELLLHNTDLFDLFLLVNQERLISFSEFKNAQWGLFGGSSGWAQPVPSQDHSLGNFVFGDIAFSDSAVFTKSAQAEYSVPVRIKDKDKYLILLRVYGGEGFSSLDLNFGGNQLSSLDAKLFRGFRWVAIAEEGLSPGEYSLEIKTEEPAPAILDSVAVIPVSEFNAGLDKTYRDFKDLPLTYIAGSQNILRADSYAATDLYIPESTTYDITLRLVSIRGEALSGRLNLKSESAALGTIGYTLQKGRPANITLDNIPIAKGRHKISIEGIPESIDLLFASFSKADNIGHKLRAQEAKLDYLYDGRTNYQGRIKAGKPLVLVQTEANYPGWKMKLGARTVEPIVSNMFLNGFIVDKAKEADFHIYYLNIWQTAGVVISLSALIIAIILIIIFRPAEKV